MIGSTLSHYKVLERLGDGGTGAAWKALDLDLARLVAIKILPADAGFGEEAKRRLLAQAAAAAALDDPQLCAILETGETGEGQPYVVTPFCEGEPLAGRLRQAPLPPSRAIELAGRIAATVARAHAHGLVHGDLKPGNVLLTREGDVRLVDFGLAGIPRPADAAGLAYRSPEQLRGEGDPEAGPQAASDVWALGVLLYQMLTGRLPYTGGSAAELLAAIEAGAPPPLPASAPPALAPILAAALARDPARRYPEAAPLRDDLAAAEGTHLLPASLGTTLLEMPPAGFEVTERGSSGGRAGGADVRPAEAGAGAVQSSDRSSAPSLGMIGRTVAHYRILDHLGTGGMGIVYKAADTKLERTVALKFLPYALTRDQRAKERFLQEARTASGLDHPNICTIHEIGETAEGQLYLAMACYEGETLGRRIERGPLPVPLAIDVALQTARGLAKAHRAGIVHRDVKPANLMLTADGLVKILDFGIAKLARAAAGATRVGFAVGTPAYMSPEQARGEDVDPRTDVWALGVVLYEMLTAERPFRGADREAVVASVQRDEPPRLSAVRPDVPPELERIVSRMLAKSPDDRYPSIAEAQADLAALEAALRDPGEGRRGSPLRAWLGAAAAVAILAAGGYVFLRSNRKPPPFQADNVRITTQEGRETTPSLSPDGRSFLYAKPSAQGTSEIYLQSMERENPRSLTADIAESCSEPAFSPDGKRFAFRSERDGGGIFVRNLAGGPLQRIALGGYNPAWSPDGREIAYATDLGDNPSARSAIGRIYRVSLADGRQRALLAGDAVQPAWSPHGLRIAYWGVTSAGRRVISSVAISGGDPVPILTDEHLNWNPVWSPDGFLYFSSDRSGPMNLWRVPIDEATGKVAGSPQPVTTSSEWNAFITSSRNGRHLAYAASDEKANIDRLGFDPATGEKVGDLEPVTTGSRSVRAVDVSPDGNWLVFDTSAPREDILVMPTGGGEPVPLIHDANKNRVPRWAPDGKTILFYSNRGTSPSQRQVGYDAWRIRPDGKGLEALTAIGSVVYPLWSEPDGRRLVYTPSFNMPGAGSNSALIDLARPLKERLEQPLPPEPHGAVFAANCWSPDGALLLGTLSRQDDPAVRGFCLFSFASGEYRHLPISGTTATWLHKSRRFLYASEGKVFLFDVATGLSTLVVKPPQNWQFISIGVAPDDRVLYLVVSKEEGDIFLLNVKTP